MFGAWWLGCWGFFFAFYLDYFKCLPFKEVTCLARKNNQFVTDPLLIDSLKIQTALVHCSSHRHKTASNMLSKSLTGDVQPPPVSQQQPIKNVPLPGQGLSPG